MIFIQKYYEKCNSKTALTTLNSNCESFGKKVPATVKNAASSVKIQIQNSLNCRLKLKKMSNQYTVINASAGSGKTYTLVQRLLMICLKYPNQHHMIQNILALTFTNKAANEMKERILSWLGEFTANNFEDNKNLKNIQEALKSEGANIPLKDLHERSQHLLDYILHHYSKLNIGTIDKFNARLVRSFSYELGLAKNFNLEIQPEPFLIEAIDQMLDKIGDQNEVSDAFIDFVSYKLDNNERVNLNKTLYDSAKEFVKDIHYDHLKSNSAFDWNRYEHLKETLRKEIRDLQKDSELKAKNALAVIQEKGLENSDFAGGGNQSIQYFFDSFLNKGEPNLYPTSEAEAKKIEHYRKGASKTGQPKEYLIFEILDFLINSREQIIQNHIKISKKQKILASLLPLKVNKDIQDELAQIEEENDVVLLSKFNVMIGENLANEPSAFIYEKVGSQFQHFFFDEFQDTSHLQWQNFIPLRDHSVSMDHTSFTLVGDPKQSIYRFRGGDSQLMLNIINKNEISPKEAELIVLDKNWRSAKNIVDFNNELYEFMSCSVEKVHQDIFGKSAQQIAESSLEGRVKVNLIDNLKKEEYFTETSARMQKDIQECLDNGFRFSDITILCRGNTEIFNFSQKLGALKVWYNGTETPIKTISESGLTLELSKTLKAVIQFLNWETNPKNMQYLTLMMYYLNGLGRVEMEDFTSEMQEILSKGNKTDIEEFITAKYGLNLQQKNFPKLNLYNFVEFYVNEFSVDQRETDFLLNFLELLYGFTQNSGATVKDFIKFWDEEARKKTIQASENVDAVQIMTIHKAKGLEFPVVLYPVPNENKDSAFSQWFPTDENEDLKSVNLKNFEKELEVYDEEIGKFNQANAYRNKIDRYCIQYVATTRPVEQLFLYIEKPGTDSKKGEEKESRTEIYNFLKSKNLTANDEFDLYPISGPEFLRKKTKEKTGQFETKGISNLTSDGEMNGSIKIATPSKSYQTRIESVRRGIFTHEILSKINTAEDIDSVLESYVLNGILTLEESAEISDYLQKIIADHQRFFEEGLEIINEKDIMISENGVSKIFRPDRLVKQNGEFHIVDFKTGEEREKHLHQIADYKTALEKIGKKVGETKLIYV